MADLFYGKGITVASGFDLGAKAPLDHRIVVDTIADRDAHVTGNRAYEGRQSSECSGALPLLVLWQNRHCQ